MCEPARSSGTQVGAGGLEPPKAVPPDLSPRLKVFHPPRIGLLMTIRAQKSQIREAIVPVIAVYVVQMKS